MNKPKQLTLGKIYTVASKKTKKERNHKSIRFTGKLIKEYPFLYLFQCRNYTTCLNKAIYNCGEYSVKER